MQNSTAQTSIEKKTSHMDVKKLVVLSLMTAIAYSAVFFFRMSVIPIAPFLDYEPKDVIITIGGFMFGPVAALIMSLATSLLEMVTISSTGPIGALMNFINSAAFACMAAIIYKRVHTIKGAVTGLAAGSILMTALMLAWNYLVTPLYMGVDRETVAAMLLPVFLPFNVVKAALNSAITMLVYKPLSGVMRKAHVLPEAPSDQAGGHMKKYAFVYVIAAFIIVTCVAVIIIWNM